MFAQNARVNALDFRPHYHHHPSPMLCVAIAINYSSGLPLIIAAGATTYIASKALVDALVNGNTQHSGRLALGHWLPIATLSITAAAAGRPDVAVGLIFSTAVACLSLAIGSVAALGPIPVPVAARRTWAMIVPTGLLAFLAGFRSSISPFAATVLALQGLCVLLLWNDHTPYDFSIKPSDISNQPRRLVFRCVQLILALLLAGIGAWLALHGIDQVAANSEFASAGLLTATLISPLLVLPIIGTGTEMAHRQQSAAAVSAHVGVALLNACALLPLVVLAFIGRQYFLQWLVPQIHNAWVTTWLFPKIFTSPLPTTVPAILDLRAVPFPLAVWRVDVIIYIGLGVFLLPAAIGRWSISRLQGIGLLTGYLLYLALSILIGIRRI